MRRPNDAKRTPGVGPFFGRRRSVRIGRPMIASVAGPSAIGRCITRFTQTQRPRFNEKGTALFLFYGVHIVDVITCHLGCLMVVFGYRVTGRPSCKMQLAFSLLSRQQPELRPAEGRSSNIVLEEACRDDVVI